MMGQKSMNDNNSFSLWKSGKEKRFRDIVEKLMVAVVVHDPDTSIVFCNRMASTLLGLSPDQMLGKVAIDPRWNFIYENGSTVEIKDYPVNLVRLNLVPMQAKVMGVKKPDLEEPTWVLCNAFPEFSDEGKLSQIVVHFTDITQEKILNQKMSDLQILFNAALDQSEIGIVITDVPSGEVRYINKSAEFIRDLIYEDQAHSEKVLSSKYFHFDGKPYSYDEIPLVRAIASGKTLSEELIIKNTGQPDRVIEANAAPVFRQDGSIMAGMVISIDTTKRHIMESEVVAFRLLADQSLMAKNRFLDVAAHELRTPVTTFSLIVQLAKRQLAKGIAIDMPMLERLSTQVDRISRLIVELLDVSRLERGAFVLQLELKSLEDIVLDSIRDFQVREPNRKIHFTKSHDHCFMHLLDSIRIYQVINNFLDNASKYTPPETIIEVKLEELPKAIRVSVIDQGPGISDDFKKIIFDAFSRGAGDYAERSGGLGLGLFISRGIIEMHRGTIGVESQLKKGSTFYFDLPKNGKHA